MKVGNRVSTIRSIQQKFASVADPYKREKLIRAALGRSKIKLSEFEFGIKKTFGGKNKLINEWLKDAVNSKKSSIPTRKLDRMLNNANRNASATETQAYIKRMRQGKKKYPLATIPKPKRRRRMFASNPIIDGALTYGGGALATVGVGVGARKIMEKRKNRELSALNELFEFDNNPDAYKSNMDYGSRKSGRLKGMRASALRDEAIRRRKRIVRGGGAAAILGLGAYGGVKLMKRRKNESA